MGPPLPLGLKLGLAFAGVLAVMLISLAVVVAQSGKADTAYKKAIAWNETVKGSAQQAAGARQQQSSQALYVATFQPRYKAEWEAGVAKSEKAAKSVEKLHDPTVTKIARAATSADEHHDATVNKLLFPAVARGDHEAALKALALADKYVRIPLQAQEQIESYVARRQTADVASAEAAGAAAKRAGIIAGLLGTLLAIAITVLVSGGVRRAAASVLERLRSLEANDATELAAGLDAIASGDLTRSVVADTPAIEKPGQDELGQIAEATNGIRDRILGSVESYNAMRDKLSGLIGEVAGSARSVASTSQQMAMTSQEAGQAVGEIASAVGEVAAGAERQARSVDAVRETAEAPAGTARPPRPPRAPRATARRVPAERPAPPARRATWPARAPAPRRRRSPPCRPCRRRRPRSRARSATSPPARARSSGSWRRSPASPRRRTCWRSTPPSRPRAPASRARASRSSPTRCASSPRDRSPPPSRSPS